VVHPEHLHEIESKRIIVVENKKAGCHGKRFSRVEGRAQKALWKSGSQHRESPVHRQVAARHELGQITR
jgi:hypothetical protein